MSKHLILTLEFIFVSIWLVLYYSKCAIELPTCGFALLVSDTLNPIIKQSNIKSEYEVFLVS